MKWLKGENSIKGPRKRRRRRKQKETVSTEFLPGMMRISDAFEVVLHASNERLEHLRNEINGATESYDGVDTSEMETYSENLTHATSMMTLLKNLLVEGAKISNEDGESAVINQMVAFLNEARSVARSKIINAGGVPTKEEIDRLAMEMMRE